VSRLLHSASELGGGGFEPVWFGPPDRSLAGYVHSPAGPALGGVLICPPMGYESICAHRTLRRIADRLAELGHLVLRFDYEGTGASCGSSEEPDLLDRCQRSVRAGIAELRRRGIPQPALVGLRLGAGLACAVAAGDGDVGPVVLWAPVTSGRRYRRELRAQAAITPGGVPGDGSLNVVGHYVAAQALRSLNAWEPLRGVDPSLAMLLVQSPGWRDAEASAQDLAEAGLRPTFLDIDGTGAVLERDAELVDVPVPLVEGICRWLDQSRGTATALPLQPLGDRTRVIDSEAAPVEEEIISMPPRGLYGVLTRPIGPVSDAGVIFLNNGVAPASGPGRAWVDFARALAAAGITSLRFDFSGLGDSPDLDPRPVGRGRPVPRTAGPELLAAVDLMRSRGVGVVTAVGLCSGAQIAVRTAAYDDRIDTVFAINPPLYDTRNIGIGPRIGRLWSLAAVPTDKRPVRDAMHRLPERVWAIFDRLSIFPSPARYLRLAAARRTHVHLVFSAGDYGLQDVEARAGRAVADLVSAKQLALQVVDGMDHSMFDRVRRADVLDALREVCLAGSAQPLDRYSSG